jgi:hypothetical protein
MVSGKLVNLIETHWDEIIDRVYHQIHREPQMSHTRSLPEVELREWGQGLLQHLGHWLSAGNEAELVHKYEHYGALRCEQDVPLHEAVRAQCILREKMLDFVEDHMFSKASMDMYNLELYEKEELERRLGRFFDLLTVHFVLGYERALRKAILARV